MLAAGSRFLSLLEELGVTENPKKRDPPTMEDGTARHILQYLGFILNTVTMTVSLPAWKLKAYMEEVNALKDSRVITVHALYSLLGKLSHASVAFPPARCFLGRLYALVKMIHKKGLLMHHKLSLTDGAKLDLKFWAEQFPALNGVSIIPTSRIVHSHLYHLWTDACTKGGGAFWMHGGMIDYIAFPWSPEDLKKDIAWKELRVITYACYLWGSSWKGKRVRFSCDNQAVCLASKRWYARNPALQQEFRLIQLCAFKRQFRAEINWILGKTNIAADALSRCHFAGGSPTRDRSGYTSKQYYSLAQQWFHTTYPDVTQIQRKQFLLFQTLTIKNLCPHPPGPTEITNPYIIKPCILRLSYSLRSSHTIELL